jgi:hypothetical protein
MNEKYQVILEKYKACGQKGPDLFDRIRAKIPFDVKAYGRKNRESALKFVSPAEWTYLNLLSFFSGCENHGTLHRDTHKGYELMEYMLEVGIKECAAVFLQLKPLQVKDDELEGDIYSDELADRSALIQEEMEKIEREMPSECYEEICVLLWKYAQKHGLDKMLDTAAPDAKGGTSP